jgi:hypothetical protein
MLDLLITARTPGIKTEIVDLYGKPEILFFGPDGESWFSPPLSLCAAVDELHLLCPVEGTAGLMDWACCESSSLIPGKREDG